MKSENIIKRILSAPVYDVAEETPIHAAPSLSKRLGNTILVKREDLQPTFSFKLRALNLLTRHQNHAFYRW